MSDGAESVPNLRDVLLYLKDVGLVGEERLGLTLAVALPWGNTIWITGPAGTGKTYSLERAMSLYPKSEFYEVSTSVSPVALFYDHERWNAAGCHIFPDVSQITDKQEGILKAIGEQKAADHTVTDVTVDDVKGKILKPGRTDVVVSASDNETVDRNNYAELLSRSTVLSTDGSVDHTQEILEWHANADAGLIEPFLEKGQHDALRAHAASVMDFARAFDRKGGTFINPVMPEIIRRGTIPVLFSKANRDYKKFRRIVEAVAIWNFPNRLRYLKEDGSPVMVIAPEDVWLAMKIFGEALIMSALNLTEEDVAVLQVLRTTKAALTKNKIQEILADPNDGHGMNLTTRLVERCLKGMAEYNYVNKDDSTSPVTYSAGMFASQVDHSISLPWEDVIAGAAENARQALPDGLGDEYAERFCADSVTTHPFTGEVVVISDDSEFEHSIAKQAKKIGDELSRPMWGPSATEEADDDPDEGTDPDPTENAPTASDDGSEGGERQGTLG